MPVKEKPLTREVVRSAERAENTSLTREVVRSAERAENTPPKPHYHGHRQRLRARLLEKGAASLADYELLEVLLFAAKPRGDVKPLAKALLGRFGSLAKVIRAPVHELEQVDGMGEAAIAAVKLSEALAGELLKEDISTGPVIQSWTALLDYCRLQMGSLKREQFRILFLNHKNRLIADEVQQEGTVDHTPVYPREVLRRALELQASAIILVHNHPSGDPTPSKADIDMTKAIQMAAANLGIRLHDHVIIAGAQHYSFKSYGLL